VSSGTDPRDPHERAPGVTAAVEDLAVALAARGLPGSLRELPVEPLPDERALQFVREASRLGMAGFMLTAVRDGELPLSATALDALVVAQLHESTTRVYLEQELVAVTGLLDDAGIESRVLEGCAVANIDYRDTALRAVTSIDLLVQPQDLRPAAEVLRRRGWRPPRSADREPRGAVALVGPTGPRLALHASIGAALGLSVDLQHLWSDGDQFVVNGRRLKALGGAQRLLHASTLALDGEGTPLLVRQRDLAEMVLFGDWRRRRLMDLATAWNAQDVLANAVRTAWRRLAIADVTALSVWAEHYRPGPRKKVRPGPSLVPAAGANIGSWAMVRRRLGRSS
jgi:hypothetical protein